MKMRVEQMERQIYCAVLRLHPADFCDEFADEMALDFDEARKTRSFWPLLGDALQSLARQWTAYAFYGREYAAEMAPAAARHPFLAGHYVMVDRGHLNFFDWVSASVLSALLVLAIGFAASVPNQRVIGYIQTAGVNHDGGLGADATAPPPTVSDVPQREWPGWNRSPAVRTFAYGAKPHGGRLYLSYSRMAPFPGPFAHGGPHAVPITLVEAVVQLILISAIVWTTSFFFRRSTGMVRRTVLTLLGLLGVAASVAFGQAPAAPTPPPAPTATPAIHLFHATGPLPSYDVATIKMSDPNARGPARGQTLRAYILSAYGVSTLSQGQVIGGPAWLGTDYYVIQGKPSDDLRDAMQTMTPEDRRSQTLMLEESLLASRFAFKAHFETRDLPVYELTAAKGGFKFKDAPAPPVYTPGAPPPPRAPGSSPLAGSIAMGTSAGITRLRGQAIPMRALISLIRNDAEINGRPIVDKTGFTGYVDNIDLKWAGLAAASSATGDAANSDAPSLFTALEDGLGLKLTETKAPTEVLVIDHIERPSEN